MPKTKKTEEKPTEKVIKDGDKKEKKEEPKTTPQVLQLTPEQLEFEFNVLKIKVNGLVKALEILKDNETATESIVDALIKIIDEN